jgi:hypothetical protein
MRDVMKYDYYGAETKETLGRIKRHIVFVPHSLFVEFNAEKE